MKTGRSLHCPPLLTCSLVAGLLLCLVQGGTGTHLHATEVFVSPSGNDAWSGLLSEPNADRSDGPVATLARARDVLRNARRVETRESESHFITLRAGTHRILEPLHLGDVDSGTKQHPLIIRAYADEHPIVSGGVVLNQVASNSNNVLRFELPEQLKSLDKIRLVLSQGRRLPLARWPNHDQRQPIAGGWAYVDGRPTSKPSDSIPGESELNRKQFIMRKLDQRKWSRPDEGELFIFTRFNFWNDIVPITSVDRSTGKVALENLCSYAIRPGDRYFVQGHREELDAEGEWYVDSQNGTLWLYQNRSGDQNSAIPPIEVAAATHLFNFREGASHIHLERLTIECCLQTAVNLVDARHCQLRQCTIRHAGDLQGHGIAFHSGQGNLATGCHIHDIGASGIFITGGQYLTLTAAQHVARGNHIHDTGVINKHSAGIWLSGVGNSAVGNSIHDLPRTGVMMPFGANNQLNTVAENHIYRVNLETQDSGAVYASGRDWLSGRGHVIRNNLIHDSVGFGWDGQRWASPYYAWGIYLDDAASHIEVTGNIVARCSRAAMMVHSGSYNRIANNIFVDGGQQQLELRGWDNRNKYWQSLQATMQQRFAEVKDQPQWQRFKQFEPPGQAAAGGQVMLGNVVEHNIFAFNGRDAAWLDVVNLPMEQFASDYNLVYSRGAPPIVRSDERIVLAWKAWQSLQTDLHSKQGDPKFIDAAHDDYQLDENSPALKLGFKPIAPLKIDIEQQR